MESGALDVRASGAPAFALGPLWSRFLVATFLGTALMALVIGIPTDLVPNPWFTRMIPAGASNFFFWIATSIVTGALLATYALPKPAGSDRTGGAGIGGGVLGLLAAGCPVCNKVVMLLLGASGALTYFEPIQPILGAMALILASAALMVRLRGVARACALPDSAA